MRYESVVIGDQPFRVQVAREGRILDVEVWSLQGRSVRLTKLLTVIEAERVFIEDLYGPAENQRRSGLGALAVNAWVVFAQGELEPDVPVYGHVFNDADFSLGADLKRARQEGRKRFWQSFGITIDPPDARGDEWLRATVGSLRQSLGLVLGAPRALSRGQFHLVV